MKRALQKLNNLDNVIKIDGQKIFNFNEKTIFITKGDQKSAPIAAASILAKCFRDDLLEKLSKQYPYYEWEKEQRLRYKETYRSNKAIWNNSIS